QLVLNTFYHFGAPLGNVPYNYYEDLQNSALVTSVVPIARGDSVGQFPIVGTLDSYFENRYPDQWNALQPMALDDHHVVVGHYAAEALGLSVGDHIQGQHGGEDGEVHDDGGYEVAAILPAFGTADDQAIFTQIEAYWRVHAHEEAGDGDGEEHEAVTGDITALLVVPTGIMELQLLKQQWNDVPNVQAVYSGKTLSDVLTLFDSATRVVQLLSVITLITGAIAIFMALLAMLLDRQKDIALLRIIGRPWTYVLRLVITEIMILTLGGVLVGTLGAHTLIWLLQDQILEWSGVVLSPAVFLVSEAYYIVGSMVVALIIACLSTWAVYRKDPLQQFSH
ncbi:MAG: ABC transporter permease, partial [Bacilli bacterium]